MLTDDDSGYVKPTPSQPYFNRELASPNNWLETFMHFIKACVGTGVLAMPFAFSNVGLYAGLVLTPIVGFICMYGIHLLVSAGTQLCFRLRLPVMTFGSITKVAFESGPPGLVPYAKAAKVIVDVLLVVQHIGFCAVYLVFIAQNIKQVVEAHIEKNLNIRIYIAAIFPFLIILNIARNLKHLAPVSIIANILLLIGLSIVLYYIFDGIGSSPVESAKAITSVATWPRFYGITIFSMASIGVVMSLENNMAKPQQFLGICGLLTIGMIVVASVDAILGFLGYYRFGNKIGHSITLNLPNNALGQTVRVIYSFCIYLSFALQLYVPMEIIWNSFERHFTSHRLLIDYAIRFSLVTVTALLTIAIPNLGGLIAFVGSFTMATLGIIFPPIVHQIVFYKEKNKCIIAFRIVRNIIMILLGLLALGVGTYFAILEMIEDFQK